MVNDLLGGGGKLLCLRGWLVGTLKFGRCGDGGCGALHQPGGGTGNISSSGMATWC
jgi:hypothetical protein